MEFLPLLRVRGFESAVISQIVRPKHVRKTRAIPENIIWMLDRVNEVYLSAPKQFDDEMRVYLICPMCRIF